MNKIVDSKSYIKDGIIYVFISGQLTANEMRRITKDILVLAAELRKSGKQPKYIFDISGLTGHDAPARQAAFEAFKTDPAPTAIVGGDVSLNLITMWLSTKAGQEGITEIFASQAEALQWLETL